MFENPRRGRQARNFITNVSKILDLKSSSEQIFSENWRWVPLYNYPYTKTPVELWSVEIKQIQRGAFPSSRGPFSNTRTFKRICSILKCICFFYVKSTVITYFWTSPFSSFFTEIEKQGMGWIWHTKVNFEYTLQIRKFLSLSRKRSGKRRGGVAKIQGVMFRGCAKYSI